MIQVSSKSISPNVDLDQVYNNYDPELFESKALRSKKVIRMKVLYESLKNISKKKVWLHEATKRTYNQKDNIEKEKAIYENLVESNLPTHHEICKVIKHQSSCGYCYEGSKE